MTKQTTTPEDCEQENTRLKERLAEAEAKMGRYETILDEIPFPISVTDMEMNWTFMNRALESLLNLDRKKDLGKHCSSCKGAACSTEQCGIAALRGGKKRTIFEEHGKSIQIDAAYLTDATGAQIGHVEILQDITAMARVTAFLEAETRRISENLTRVAAGNTEVNLTMGATDRYTEKVAPLIAGIDRATAATLESLDLMLKDVAMLVGAGKDGRLSMRADAARHKGGYRALVQDVNALLDTVIVPLQGAAKDAELIGMGQIPEKVDATQYKGDFRKLAESFNNCTDGLQSLREGYAVLQRTAQNDYTVKVDGNYPGGYARIAEAINVVQDRLLHLQDAVGNISQGDLKDLEAFRRIGRRSKNDQMVPAFIAMMEAIQRLVDDANMLAKAGREGKLSTRADASKHQGEFAEVVDGVNQLFDSVVAPVNEAMRVTDHYAGGDYTKKFSDDLAVAGDFQKFKDALNNMADRTAETIRDIQHIAEQVDYGTSESNKGVDQLAKAAEQVAITSQTCADLSKETLQKIEEVGRRIADLSSSNEEMASTSQDVLERAENVAKIGMDAERLGKDANTKITAVEKSAQESVQSITELTAEMREINKIVKLITDISNQTNLLALNAAIEAARAGEHGRGFAVVAGEVRNLAGESKKATNDIENLITSIQAKSEKTATAITSANTEISSSVESVNNAILALNRIVDGAGKVTRDMGEMAKAIEDQANTSNAVVKIVDEGTRLTKENMAEVEALAALAEESSASTEEIDNAVHELTGMAGDLKSSVKKFRI
ncbi:MAG: methyl-accepting chemotaxis protein [Methanofollis sp.]|uniref:methyl-accepting chemotaxis protein n=1 Tax=Methanofollis sp. TaxID=2052835 RepID=UPI002601FC06|nr:methyl-accepting chemotaxis protein [Methanofollis sp.]MDD4254718.1 methyl-accepting chemotaxis protein [Methanofollis sp.]